MRLLAREVLVLPSVTDLSWLASTQCQQAAAVAQRSLPSRGACLPAIALMVSGAGHTLSTQAPWGASWRRAWGLERTAGTEDGHENHAPADVPPATQTHGHALADGHARLHRRHR